MKILLTVLIAVACAALTGCAASGPELNSWADGAPRDDIIDFVDAVTTPGHPDYVPESERIAVFDNDGTLWAERPVYFQLLFAIDTIKALAPENPQWRDNPVLAAAIDGDMERVAEGGTEAILEVVFASHAGTTTEEFEQRARAWLDAARHPDSGERYTDMVYAPMLELLEYLRANGFKTFIVSGGGIDLIRVFSEDVYGIPPEQVVGSGLALEYEVTDAGPVIQRRAEIDFIDDKAGKPVGIHRHIGRRPIAAFGNSDGDLQMLEWTAARDGRSLCVLIHHTDAVREYAYDRSSHVGRLDKALTAAASAGWTVVDIRQDWHEVFGSDRK